MANLWDNTYGYRVLKKYVCFIIRSSYSSVSVSGRENIPTDGSVIFAANHTNTLMDPLVVLQDSKGPISFGARADIFRKPKVASILKWIKILPLARQRDGRDAVAHNAETFGEIVDCITHGAPFVIFPEGTHTPKHSLKPVKKGVFRIASMAVSQSDKPVYVVPVGIEYEDFFNFRCAVKLKYGTPIHINDYLNGETDEPEALNHLTETLYSRIKELILWFPDDENYDIAFAKYKLAHSKPENPLLNVIVRILCMPFFLIAAALSLPIWLPSELIVRNKLKDKAWSNTVRFGFKLCLTIPLVIAATALSFCLLPWWVAVPISFVAVPFAHTTFYTLIKLYKY